MLTTLAHPTDGQIVINGYDMTRDPVKVKGQIGVVPQHMNLDTELTARENLELHCRLHRISRAERCQRIKEMLEFAGLADRANDLVAVFSGRMKRRLMIARALIHRPAILFLDEPTVGLDPHSRRSIREGNLEDVFLELTNRKVDMSDSKNDHSVAQSGLSA